MSIEDKKKRREGLAASLGLDNGELRENEKGEAAFPGNLDHKRRLSPSEPDNIGDQVLDNLKDGPQKPPLISEADKQRRIDLEKYVSELLGEGEEKTEGELRHLGEEEVKEVRRTEDEDDEFGKQILANLKTLQSKELRREDEADLENLDENYPAKAAKGPWNLKSWNEIEKNEEDETRVGRPLCPHPISLCEAKQPRRI